MSSYLSKNLRPTLSSNLLPIRIKVIMHEVPFTAYFCRNIKRQTLASIKKSNHIYGRACVKKYALDIGLVHRLASGKVSSQISCDKDQIKRGRRLIASVIARFSTTKVVNHLKYLGQHEPFLAVGC